jgi:hypothetical protein
MKKSNRGISRANPRSLGAEQLAQVSGGTMNPAQMAATVNLLHLAGEYPFGDPMREALLNTVEMLCEQY